MNRHLVQTPLTRQRPPAMWLELSMVPGGNIMSFSVSHNSSRHFSHDLLFCAMDLTGITVLIIGIILGGVAVYALISQFSKDRSPPAEEMKDAFTALSMEALSKSTDEFLKLASETLKGQLEKGESTLEEKRTDRHQSGGIEDTA